MSENIVTKADVLIVGAGPAGCAAAYDLNGAGFDVLLLDKKAFPRLKPCAGALTIKTIQALRFDISPVIRQVCCDLEFGLRTEKTTLFPSRDPIAVMTVRSEFDDFCLGQCLQRGIRFQQVEALSGIRREGGHWAVAATARVFRAPFLIGADGANSQVRKLLNLAPMVRFGVAVEAALRTEHASQFNMRMDFGAVPWGYGWVFPKNDHLNVGLYTLGPKIPGAREKLATYCKVKTGLDCDREIHGHGIPYGGVRFRHTPGSAILVGDAAGLIDPLLGEGIYNAVRSGQIAAAAVIDMARGRGDTYGKRIREITSDLASYAFHVNRFYSNVDRAYGYLTWPVVRYVLMKGFSVGLTVQQIQWRFPLLPLLRPHHDLVP